MTINVIKLIWVWKFHKYLHIIKYKMYLTSLSVTNLYYKTLYLWQIQYDIVQQSLLTRYLTVHVQCHKNMHVQ